VLCDYLGIDDPDFRPATSEAVIAMSIAAVILLLFLAYVVVLVYDTLWRGRR